MLHWQPPEAKISEPSSPTETSTIESFTFRTLEISMNPKSQAEDNGRSCYRLLPPAANLKSKKAKIRKSKKKKNEPEVGINDTIVWANDFGQKKRPPKISKK